MSAPRSVSSSGSRSFPSTTTHRSHVTWFTPTSARLTCSGAPPTHPAHTPSKPSATWHTPAAAHDRGGDAPGPRQPGLIGVDEHEFGDLDLVSQPRDPVDELGGVGGTSANDCEFHPNAFTSAPDWATWQAASWPPAMGSSFGVTVWQMSIASGHPHRNRQPVARSLT